MNNLKKLVRNPSGSSDALELFEKVYDQNQHYIEPTDWRLKNFSDIYSLDFSRIRNEKNEPVAQVFEEATKIIEDEPTIVVNQPKAQTPQNQPQNNLVGDPVVLNDTLKKNQENLADSFQQAKIEDIRSAISLNQKFLFTNRLFNGDSFAFNDAITKIESCKDFNEATYVINQEYSGKYNWDFESDEVNNFIQIIQRKFS